MNDDDRVWMAEHPDRDANASTSRRHARNLAAVGGASVERSRDDFNGFLSASMFGPITATAQTVTREAAERIARGVKRCSKCGIDRPLEDFNHEPRARDGHRPECGTCQREAGRAAYRRKVSGEIVADLRPALSERRPRV